MALASPLTLAAVGATDDVASWNDALNAATTEWFAVVRAGAELTDDAAIHLPRALRLSDADVVYTDERVTLIDGDDPIDVLKPGWSPRLVLEGNYVGSLCIYRVSTLRRIGGFTPEDVATRGYDTLLRAADSGAKFEHLPIVAINQPADERWPVTDVACAERSVARRGLFAEVEAGPIWHRVRFTTEQRGVSIIIPTRDRVELLRTCIESVERLTDYPTYEIIVIDNGSVESDTLAYLDAIPHRVIPHPGVFNFSDLMNVGAAAASHPLLLLLNNDAEVQAPDWLSVMVSELADPEVASVGCLLLAADGSPQHEGVGLGLRGAAAVNVELFGYCHFDQAVRDVVGVTAACVLVRKDVYDGIGGFDHELAVGFGDVDFCLRLRQHGHRIIYTPNAVVRHLGMASRGEDSHRADDLLFAARWPLHRARQLDPFVNPRIEAFDPLWVTPVEAILS